MSARWGPEEGKGICGDLGGGEPEAAGPAPSCAQEESDPGDPELWAWAQEGRTPLAGG